MKNQKTMGNKGFSLVELIVVIAIMAVLVGVLAPQFIKYVENSRQSTDMQNIQQAKTAIEVYVADNENLTGTVTITVKGADVTYSTLAATAADATGAKITKLKSSGWPEETYTYDTSNYTWGGPATPAVNAKGKGTNKMASVFGK